jgi:putative ABC transport system ATP-binding protein
VVEAFTIANVIDPELQRPDPNPPRRIEREVSVSNLAIRDESGSTLLDSTSVRIAPGEAVAAVGPVGSGGEFLAEALARLQEPFSGRILIDGTPIETLPDAVVGRRIGYAEASTYLPQSSLHDSLIYGLRHAPLRPAADKDARAEQRRLHEATKAGNTAFDIGDDWIDYESAGATGPEDLLARLREVLVVVDLENDVYRLGLRSRLPGTPTADLESPTATP